MSEGRPKAVWRRVKFEEIAENVQERVDDPSSAGVERYVGLEHIEPGSLKIRRWGAPSDVEATKLRFWTGDVIFGRRRAYQRKLAVADFDGICSAHALVLRQKTGVIVPGYLPFFMQGDVFMERAVAISVGSLSPTINWTALREQEFALPPLEYQARHAKLLAASTALQDATRALRGRLDSVVASFMQESLTAGSEETTQYCRDLIRAGMLSFQTGPFGTVLNASAYKESGHPVINPVDIADGRIEPEKAVRIGDEDWARLEKYWLKAGDVLLGRKGHMHKLVIIGSEHDGYVVGSDCIRLRVDQSRIDPRYFYYVLRSDATQHWLQAQAGGNGTVMPGMNEVILGRLKVALPDLETQRRIVLELDRLVGAAAEVRVRQLHGANLHKRLLEASID